MKDKHNVILILVSSKRLILYSGGSSNSLFQLLSSFLSRSSNLFQLYHHGDSSKSLQGFTLCFNFSFLPVWSSFCYRSSSWRFYKMVLQGFNSFSKCSSRLFSEELMHSSSCNPECNSFYRIIGGGIMSFLIIWVHVSWFTCCQVWDILNQSTSSLELSWVIFHLKISLRIVANYGDNIWSKFFIYPHGELSFSSPCWYQSNLLFPLVADFHLIVLRCFP